MLKASLLPSLSVYLFPESSSFNGFYQVVVSLFLIYCQQHVAAAAAAAAVAAAAADAAAAAVAVATAAAATQ